MGMILKWTTLVFRLSCCGVANQNAVDKDINAADISTEFWLIRVQTMVEWVRQKRRYDVLVEASSRGAFAKAEFMLDTTEETVSR